jgi:hypothetical protein
MIRKTEKLVITFYTTTAAMAMEQAYKGVGASGRIIPVPGSITADCGLAWCAHPDCEATLLDLMARHDITYQGCCCCMV